MDRKLWQLIYHVVMSLDDANSSPSWTTHSDRVIVMIELWATAHEQSILWATRPQHWRWPELMPAALPHQSTVSRRQRSASVIALRAAFYGRLRQVVAVGWLQEIDGRGAHRSHRNGSASDMKGYSPRAMPKENTVSSGRGKPVRQEAEPAIAVRTSRRPSPCRSGRAADRPRSGPV